MMKLIDITVTFSYDIAVTRYTPQRLEKIKREKGDSRYILHVTLYI